jgi:hypothetical protein
VQVGSEAVDWMVKTGRATDRKEAAKFGQLLVLGNYIHALDSSAPFEDRFRFYRCVVFVVAAVFVSCCCRRCCCQISRN